MKEPAMTKAATITEIEHKIEALNPTDQLKLLERMVRHLKHAITGQPQVKRRKTVTTGVALTLRGALKQHAAPELREREAEAFAHAMQEKHALR
jgi:hypothetical protein